MSTFIWPGVARSGPPPAWDLQTLADAWDRVPGSDGLRVRQCRGYYGVPQWTITLYSSFLMRPSERRMVGFTLAEVIDAAAEVVLRHQGGEE